MCTLATESACCDYAKRVSFFADCTGGCNLIVVAVVVAVVVVVSVSLSVSVSTHCESKITSVQAQQHV